MEALILSCSTGGGHNTAAQAVFEALMERGHHAVRMDPYTLVSEELANKVGQAYIKLVQKTRSCLARSMTSVTRTVSCRDVRRCTTSTAKWRRTCRNTLRNT